MPLFNPPETIAFTEAELDFGLTPTYTGSFVVLDSTILTSSKISASQSADAPTGKSQDENEMDTINFKCVPIAAGSFRVYAQSDNGPIIGNYKMNYQVG